MATQSDCTTKTAESFKSLFASSVKQIRIYQELSSFDPTLGDLYAYAAVGCVTYGNAKDERAHISLIGHAVRELTNALPEVLFDGDFPKHYGPVQAAKRKLFDLVDGNSLNEDSAKWLRNDPEALQSIVSALVEYRKEEAEAGMSARTRSAYALLGSPQPKDASLAPWEKAKDFFMDFVHIDRTFKGALPSHDELSEQFSRIETGLAAALHTFFSAKQELKPKLDLANTKLNGNYEKPTESQVLDLLAFLADANLRLIFYASLENPHWLGPLHDLGAFAATPPDPQTGRCWQWPQGDYLYRMAEANPGKVCVIAVSQIETENWIAREHLIRIANALPEVEAAELSNGIAKWADSPAAWNHWYWASDELVNLIIKLQNGPENLSKRARRLLYACFEPRRMSGHYGDIAACIPDFKYAEALDAVTANMDAKQTCRLTTKMLRIYQDLAAETSPIYRDSSYTIPDMLVAEREFRDALPIALSQHAVIAMTELAEGDPAFLAHLLKESAPSVVQRAAVLSVAIAIERCGAEGPPEKLSLLAEKALDSDRLFSWEFDAENHRLCKACASYAANVSLTAMQRRLVDGGVVRAKLRAEQFIKQGINADDAQSQAWEPIRRRQHRHLLSLGEGQLTPDGRTLLDNLNAELGDVEYHCTHVVESNWNGPEPGKTAEELFAMAPDEVMSFLESWVPDDFNHEFSSQAGALANLIRKEPGFFENHEERLSTQRPEYCSAIAYAWYGVSCQGGQIPRASAIRFCLAVCDKARQAATACPDEPVAEGYNDSWIAALTLMLHIVEMSVDDNERLECFKSQMFDAFRKAMANPEEHADDGRRTSDSAILPLTIAFNTAPLLGFRGVAAWAKAFREESGSAELDRCVEQALQIAERSEAMSAQVAERVWAIDELGYDCEKLLNPLIADGDRSPSHQVFITTFLAIYHPHPKLLSLVGPGIELLLSSATPYKLGISRGNDDALDLVGRWVDFGYIVNALETEDPLFELWERSADAKHLGNSLEHACRALYNTDAPTEQVLERISNLWDRRVELAQIGAIAPEALMGFRFLVKSGAFNRQWWAPRLKTWCKLNPQPRDLSLIGDEMVELAKHDPMAALSALSDCASKALEDDKAGPWLFSDIAAPILYEAKNLQDHDANQPWEKCMDDLAQLGLVSLDDQIAEQPNRLIDDDSWTVPQW
ncbi:MAG: hypothetical protein Q4B54_04710 [Coriobacteriales bacterium]|nr:hypothetical protein [Coriobacteriales bacterium]